MILIIKKYLLHLACLFILFLTSACSTVPFTNRSQLTLIPEGEVMSMSRKQYSDVKTKSRVIKTGLQAERIQRVGKHLAAVIDEWMIEEGVDREFEWEFILIQDKQVNAWCMPGGKVAFYTGIMKYCDSDQAVAVDSSGWLATRRGRRNRRLRLRTDRRIDRGLPGHSYRLGLLQASDRGAHADPCWHRCLLHLLLRYR